MKILVLGLGNPILCDDSIGLHVAQLVERKVGKGDVTVMHAGISGLDFLDVLSGYDCAIIIDAIQTRNGRVGDYYRLEAGAFDATKHESTPHHLNFATVLELGKKLGVPLPSRIIIYAIEVKDTNSFSESCTPEVAMVVPEVADMVLKELEGACCA